MVDDTVLAPKPGGNVSTRLARARVRKAAWPTVTLIGGPAGLTIMDMHNIAASRGGRCLSDSYKNAQSHLDWECGVGHRWRAVPAAIRAGGWCPSCAGRRTPPIEDVQRFATERHGQCLSSTLSSTRDRLRWRCEAGHEWLARVSHVMAGSWCPICARRGSSAGERISRGVLEAMFGEPFLKARPSWLPGEKGRSLELDGFAPKARIAFEYHGPQHYEVLGHLGESGLAAQQRRDGIKRKTCHEQGVALIVIPEFSELSDLSGCIDQIEHAVLWAGLAVPRRWKRPTELPSASDPLPRIFGESRLALLRTIAEEKGGALISTSVTRADDHLLWRCREGHDWKARAHNVRRGTWCPACAPRRRWEVRRRRRDLGWPAVDHQAKGPAPAPVVGPLEAPGRP